MNVKGITPLQAEKNIARIGQQTEDKIHTYLSGSAILAKLDIPGTKAAKNTSSTYFAPFTPITTPKPETCKIIDFRF